MFDPPIGAKDAMVGGAKGAMVGGPPV